MSEPLIIESDTPRTDKLAGDWIACELVPASWARELERENARLVKSGDKLEADLVDTLAQRDRHWKRICKVSKALQFCLGCLKSHHLTKPGISTLVRKTEEILLNVSRQESPARKDHKL